MSNGQKRKHSACITEKKRPPTAPGPPAYSVEMTCPRCGRRACDLSGYAREPLWLGLKCPHCRNIVHLECTAP